MNIDLRLTGRGLGMDLTVQRRKLAHLGLWAWIAGVVIAACLYVAGLAWLAYVVGACVVGFAAGLCVSDIVRYPAESNTEEG